jgi:hypothetical protein
MDRRDWELLVKQMPRFSPPRDNGIMGLTVASVSLLGLIMCGILFRPESGPMRVASNHAKIAAYLPNGFAPSSSE